MKKLLLLFLIPNLLIAEETRLICDEKFNFIKGYDDPKLQKKYNLDPYLFNTTDTFKTIYYFTQNKNIEAKSIFRDSKNTKFRCLPPVKKGVNEKTGEYLGFTCFDNNRFKDDIRETHIIGIRKYSPKKYFLSLTYKTEIKADGSFIFGDEFSTISWAKCTEQK